MRARSLPSPVLVFGVLLCGAVGCQVIGGISGLEVKEGSGGGASTSSTTSSQGGGSTASQGGGGAAQTTTSSAGGVGGMAGGGGAMQGGGGTGGGTPCQIASECGADDDCTAYSCVAGKCQVTYASANAACGDSTDDDCKNPDTCDGNGHCLSNDEADGTNCGSGPAACSDQDTCQGGVCQPNDKADGTACGSSVVTDCSGADTCKGGVCNPNDALLNATCGGKCANDAMTPLGVCDGNGNCSAQPKSCGTYSCAADGTACNTTCADNSECASGNFCAGMQGAKSCVTCGLSAPSPTCSGLCTMQPLLGQCNGSTCMATCASASCGAVNLPPDGPATYTCNNGACNSNTDVYCQGGSACTLVCKAGTTCNGVTLHCADGPCTVQCQSGATCGGVAILCGNNQCTATCQSGQSVSQFCAAACGCTKSGCN